MSRTAFCGRLRSITGCPQQRVQLGRVLGQSPVADLSEAELALDDAKGVFAPSPDGIYDPSARLESISVPTFGS